MNKVLSPTENIKLWNDQHLFGGMEILKAQCFEYHYPPHFHDVFVIAAFKNGAQKHRIAGKQGIAYPGTVMIIPPGDVHTGESAVRGSGWEYSAFYPTAGSLERLSQDLFQSSRGYLDFGTSVVIDDQDLANKLLAASDLVEHSQFSIERKEAVYSTLELLVRRYGRRTFDELAICALDRPIHRGIEFMRENFSQAIKLEDIAGAVNLSEFHFMRVFKAGTNMTVHQYLTQLRLESAKELLAKGETIAATAFAVGFYDQSHFTAKFRKYFGVTPLRYANACC